MFACVEMKDSVNIPASQLHLDIYKTIISILNKRYANKVIHNVGLCIAVRDLAQIEDSYIFWGQGGTHTVVHFNLVVFRPFMDEILTGKVKSCSPEGIQLTMGFFDDIFISADCLPYPSRFSETEQMWVWMYEMEDGKHDLYIEIGEEVRFRVIDEKFVDTSPTGPEGVPKEDPDSDSKKSPYTIIGYMADSGLGLLSWWNQGQ